MKNVLFVCVHNSGRSQMAEAFAKKLGKGKLRAESAGTMPGSKVNPIVVQAMKELGIDISKARPRLLTEEMIKKADKVFTMGCSVEEACPAVFVQAEDWALEDPSGKSLDEVRKIRDQVRLRVEALIKTA